jgi:hypothetical protein
VEFGDFFRYFTEGVIVKPKLLNIIELFNLRTEFDNVIERQVQSHQVPKLKYFRQDDVEVHLTQVESIGFLGSDNPSLYFIVLSVRLVSGK